MVIDKPACNVESNTYIDNSLNIYIESPKIKVRQWVAVANMNAARYGAVSFSIGSYGYVCCGQLAYNEETNKAEKYDPVTNTWSYIANCRETRSLATGFSIGSYGYVCGGYVGGEPVNSTGNSEKYNPATNTWSYIKGMNNRRYGASSFVIDGKGYVCSGFYYATALKVVERYDPIADTWTNMASTSSYRSYAAAFSINGYGYICGGGQSSPGKSIEKYDPITNRWSHAGFLTYSRWYTTAFVLYDEGYICGGPNGTCTVEKYNPTTNTCTLVDYTEFGRKFSSAFSIGTKGYICGGHIYDGTNSNLAMNSTECYGDTELDTIVDTYYTLDNTTPKITSNKFSNEFRIYKDTILKAKAISGSDESEVLTVDIKFDKLITQSETLTNTLLFAPDLIYKDPYYDKFKQVEHTLKLEGDDTE